MYHSKEQNISLNAALLALTNELGADQAAEKFFLTIDNNTNLRVAEKTVLFWFQELGIEPGAYDKENLKYENEHQLKNALSLRLSQLSTVKNSWK